jgi:hypothetical protein
MVSIEEGSIGGFAAHVMQFLALDGLLDGGLKFRPMTLPDRCAAAAWCCLARAWGCRRARARACVCVCVCVCVCAPARGSLRGWLRTRTRAHTHTHTQTHTHTHRPVCAGLCCVCHPHQRV